MLSSEDLTKTTLPSALRAATRLRHRGSNAVAPSALKIVTSSWNMPNFAKLTGNGSVMINGGRAARVDRGGARGRCANGLCPGPQRPAAPAAPATYAPLRQTAPADTDRHRLLNNYLCGQQKCSAPRVQTWSPNRSTSWAGVGLIWMGVDYPSTTAP